jgi:S1-C subfamily serine protease
MRDPDQPNPETEPEAESRGIDEGAPGTSSGPPPAAPSGPPPPDALGANGPSDQGGVNTEPFPVDEQAASGEPTLTGEPTREVPGAPPYTAPWGPPPAGSAPWPPSDPAHGGYRYGPPQGYGSHGYGPQAYGSHGYGTGSPGYGPSQGGQGYGSPPPYGPGPWSSGPPMGGPWHWAPAPAGPKGPTRPGLVVLTLVVAAAVAIAAVLVGHQLWKNAANASSPGASVPGGGSSNPFGIGGGSSTPSSGSGSSGSGGPSNAASIAKGVDPGLVDVNIQVGYSQGVEGEGTGMVLTSNGEILTNNHVVESETNISVTDVSNGKQYQASVVGYDRSADVSVIQLKNASGLPTVTLGNSSGVNSGQGVVAVGNAGGTGGTPSWASGSITGTNQSITASDEATGGTEQLSDLLETNADIIPGDSGGPLVNSSGQVIGMDTASSGSGGGFEFNAPSNQGFAIPINQAISDAKKIEAGQASSSVHVGPTAFLGVEIEPSNSGNGTGGSGSGSGSNSGTSGALIEQTIPGGPADSAGLQGGDTITSVDGHNVATPEDLTNVMVQQKPGAKVQVQYVDNSGQQQSTTVTLSSGPPQ